MSILSVREEVKRPRRLIYELTAESSGHWTKRETESWSSVQEIWELNCARTTLIQKSVDFDVVKLLKVLNGLNAQHFLYHISNLGIIIGCVVAYGTNF